MASDIQQSLQEQLRDIHLPETIGWWPPAIGWWLLLGVILLAAALGLWALWRDRARNRYRKLALAELDSALDCWRDQRDPGRYVQAANTTLKRALAYADPRAPLSTNGTDWVDVLDQYCDQPFSETARHALAFAGYEPDPQVDIASVHSDVCRWLKRHRNSTSSRRRGGAAHA